MQPNTEIEINAELDSYMKEAKKKNVAKDTTEQEKATEQEKSQEKQDGLDL